jgi:phosphatidylglycerol---prolipoprotein diacylglyceryl transferase
MYPFLNIGSWHIGTFGLLLWLAAVCATVVLHRNFIRNGVDADALNVVAFSVIAGILGAKAWHELQDPARILPEIHLAIRLSGGNVLLGFLHWFQTGFAWFGGLIAAIAVLMWQGAAAKPNGLRGLRGAIRMLDLSAPAAALGYGVGRIGCLLSGDGDYGINTTLPWGVHMMTGADEYHRALVLPTPPNALVQPTPLYEFLFGVVLAWWLWRRASKPRPLGFLTGEYLLISGVGRFLVEFVRINPKIYFWHTMSNAQVAALASVVVGGLIMWATRRNEAVVAEPLPKVIEKPATA